VQIAEFRNRAARRCVAQRRTRRDSGANPIQIKLSKNARNVGSKGVTRVYYIYTYIYIYARLCWHRNMQMRYCRWATFTTITITTKAPNCVRHVTRDSNGGGGAGPFIAYILHKGKYAAGSPNAANKEQKAASRETSESSAEIK